MGAYTGLSSGATPRAENSTAIVRSTFAAATAANTKFEKRPTSIGITTPVGKAIPKGKVIDFIQCGVPACAVEGNILASATTLLGWTLDRLNAGTSSQTIADAYQQAVTNKPAAVIGSGYPKVLFATQLKALAAEHVPVLEAFVADNTGGGLTGVVAGNVTNNIQGQEVADYILANSNDKSQTVGVVVPPAFPNMVVEQASALATFKKYCPPCKAQILAPPVTSIGANLPSLISSFLTANPSIKWLWDGYDDMVTGLPTALKGASITNTKVVTISMNGTVAADIQQHDYVLSGVGTSFPEVYWREIDLLTRLFTHQSYAVDLNDSTLPYWTITAANLPSNAGATLFANVVNYKHQFEKLWGLG
jgi:ribose transport system substrate-binding protein